MAKNRRLREKLTDWERVERRLRARERTRNRDIERARKTVQALWGDLRLSPSPSAARGGPER